MIIINLKNYKSGKEVINFVKKLPKKMFVAVPTINLENSKKVSRAEIIAQHVDLKDSERDTGFITPNSLKESEIKFSLLNHSEHPVSLKEIEKTIYQCRKNKIKIICCTPSIWIGKKIAKFGPYAIAYEDSKLIESGKSIVEYEPRKIKRFAKIMKKRGIIPICGAGISSIEDVIKAKELGCEGVLISSAISKSKNPSKFLKELESIK
jgi:triosephosphate isomerase